MKLLTVAELMRLPRFELIRLERQTLAALDHLAEGAAARPIAHENLKRIRFVLVRLQAAPA